MIQYAATDTDVLPGTSYYRLRQTDFNGTSTLSHVEVVRSNGSSTFSVYPNPSSAAEITLPGNAYGQLFEVRSVTGQLIDAGQLGSNRLPTGQWPSGTFLLILRDPVSGQSRSCAVVRY